MGNGTLWVWPLPRHSQRLSPREPSKAAPHSRIPPCLWGQVGRNSLRCFGTHGRSLLSAKHLALSFEQMFQHRLGVSFNPKTKLIWLTRKEGRKEGREKERKEGKKKRKRKGKKERKESLLSQNSRGTLVYVSNGAHFGLSGTLIYRGFLCTDLPPSLEDGCLGKRHFLFASVSPIHSTGPGTQKVLKEHL